MKGSLMGSTIPSFQASLIQNIDTNKTPAPSVEEILADKIPAVQTPAEDTKTRSSHTGLKVVGGALALTALGVLGRRGNLGKSVQKFLGGIPKLSTEQIQERITSKLADYVSRTEAAPFELKVLANGKTVASRILTNGEKELISFSNTTGLPEARVQFGKDKGKGALSYISYKGADILDDGFDAANNFFKKYTRSGTSRKHLIGQKHNTAHITYGDMVRGDGQTTLIKENVYYNNGNLNHSVERDGATGNVVLRDILYGTDNKAKGLDIVSGDGTIIRKLKGEAPIFVDAPNRKMSKFQKLLRFFSYQKPNVIE